MATFTIDSENNIVAGAIGDGRTATDLSGQRYESFASQKELDRLAQGWGGQRLIEVWNSFAGVEPFDDLKPVKKFTSRKIAVARIWEAVQRLSPDGEPEAAAVAPAEGKSKKTPPKSKKRAPARKGADESRTNKKAEVIAVMKRPKGVTQSPEPDRARSGQAQVAYLCR